MLLDGLGDDLVDELDDRRVVGGLAQVDDLRAAGRAASSSLDVAETTSSSRSRRPMRPTMSSGGGDRDAHLVAGHDRDVVDREHVGGVGHRHEQRALAGEADRHRLVALGGGGRDEVGGAHVDREDAQVEVVEPVALGERAREPVLVERPALEQHLSGVDAGDARGRSTAFSICSRETSPRSTMTSVRKREEEPRRDGLVTPVGGVSGRLGVALGGPRRLPAVVGRRSRSASRGRRRGPARRRSSSTLTRGSTRPSGSSSPCRPVEARSSRPPRRPVRRASMPAPRRIASSGAGAPVQSSKLSAPWATSTSRPSTVARPEFARGGEQRVGPCS